MKPMNTVELRAVAQRRLTCAPLDCTCEQDCFRLAEALLQMLPDEVVDEPEDPDTVAGYAPDWSAT